MGEVRDSAGDFAALFHEFVPSVRAFVRTLVSPADVEPIVSVTFETAWAKFDEIPPAAPKAWLFGVARNHVRNLTRAQRRRQALVDALQSQRPETETGLYAGRVDPAELVTLIAALHELSDDDRLLLQLASWDGFTSNQIGVVLGISPEAARVRLHRARRRLTARLADDPSRQQEQP